MRHESADGLGRGGGGGGVLERAARVLKSVLPADWPGLTTVCPAAERDSHFPLFPPALVTCLLTLKRRCLLMFNVKDVQAVGAVLCATCVFMSEYVCVSVLTLLRE